MFTLLGKIIKYCFYILIILIIILSVIPYLFSLNNKAADADYKPYPNSKFIKSAANSMHYRVFKPDTIENKIVLIHGFSGSTFCYRNNFESLISNKTLVIALDLPPYGFSNKEPDANYNDTTILSLIHSAIQQTDNEIKSNSSWIVAGHSLGAMYAAKLVTQHPALFKKQIFIDGFFTDLQETGFNFFLKYPPLLRWSDVVLEHYLLNKEKFGELIESAYLRKATNEEIEGYMKPFETKNSASSILHWAHAESVIQVDKLTLYSKPTLILWGNPDPWVPFDIKKVDTTAFKKITFKFIDGGGHNPQETQPELVNNYLNEFINN
jgi:2-hydroxy-6-oxonona-2,4-dienedioate hydrolase